MSNIKPLLILSLMLLGAIHTLAGDKDRGFDLILSGTEAEPRILACKAPEFSFHLPQMAGNFRLGIACGTESLWGSDLKNVSVKEEKGKLTYTLKDPLLGNGSITIRVAGLSDSDGVILEVKAGNLPEGRELMWSFGGCYGKVLDDHSNSTLEPAYCKYNVFSVEGSAFSAYYGESMRLRVIQGVTPPDSGIRLSDAHKQQTPLAFFGSGKKTDAPALAAATPLDKNGKLYFCFYTRNRKADYNYYMLPELFKREFNKK